MSAFKYYHKYSLICPQELLGSTYWNTDKVCNTALSVHNQTIVIMSLHSFYHYHAKWLLMTDPWIKQRAPSPKRRWSKLACCCCIQKPQPAAKSHCSESADLCLNSHREVKDRQLAAILLTRDFFLLNMDSKTQRFRYFLSLPFLYFIDTLKPCLKIIWHYILHPFVCRLSCHHRHTAWGVRSLCLSPVQSSSY